MLRIFTIFSLLFSLFCSFTHPDYASPDVIGWLTPIQLQGENTAVEIEDYFLNPQNIKNVVVDDNLVAGFTKDMKVLNIGIGDMKNLKKLPLLTNLVVTMKNGATYSILIKKPTKQIITLALKDKGYKKVQVKGELNAWNPVGSELTKVGDTWQRSFELNAGNYQYLFVTDDKNELKDPENPKTQSNGIGGINSLLVVQKSDPKKIPNLYTAERFGSVIYIGYDNRPTEVFAYWENKRIKAAFMDKKSEFFFAIPKEANKLKRSFLRVFSYNESGVSNDLLIPLENGKVVTKAEQLNRQDREAQIMYFALVDRFNNGNKENDNPVRDSRVLPQANWQGGDIKGITQKIKDGYFKSLNINSIWISPITQNPDSAWQEFPEPRRFYTGYHGYWPVLSSAVDKHFGSDAELQEMVTAAHENGINILLDYVCHHVHVQHPMYQQHPTWITALDLPDGRKNIRIWDEQRLTTWFDTFLPTLDLDKPEVIEMNTDSTLFWLKKFNLDGFRHDATKHIPQPFWRSLTRKIKRDVLLNNDGKTVYQIGETYGSRDLIQSYIGSGMMDSQFDFPLYFDAREAFAKGQESSFAGVETALRETFSYFGSHHSMGNISGNHDIPRFISLAGGALRFDENDREAGFSREVGVGDKVGYKRLQMINAFNMSIAGVPVIYYGDEIGIAGAGDPDNRKMMRFENWTKDEQETKNIVSAVTTFRKNRLSLTYGDTEILLANEKTLVLLRSYFGEVTIAVFNKSSTSETITFEIPKRFAKSNLKTNFSSTNTQMGTKISVTIPPTSFDYLTN